MISNLYAYTPLKKVNKYDLKFKQKPWITLSLQKCISARNNLLKRFITLKRSSSKTKAL